MQIFITGTDTNIGKTLVSTWLCIHSGYKYIKPIQTGSTEGNDSDFVLKLTTKEQVYKEIYKLKQPVAPYLAAYLESKYIDLTDIKLPTTKNLIVEGAGGVMVPINKKYLMIDLIKYLKLPVILVARTTLGTINHTLLTIELLRQYKLNILGIILSGEKNIKNQEAIEFYGKVNILAHLPYLKIINKKVLLKLTLPTNLTNLLNNDKINK